MIEIAIMVSIQGTNWSDAGQRKQPNVAAACRTSTSLHGVCQSYRAEKFTIWTTRWFSINASASHRLSVWKWLVCPVKKAIETGHAPKDSKDTGKGPRNVRI
jgi:hypothetical protein